MGPPPPPPPPPSSRPRPPTTKPAFRRVQSKQTRDVVFGPHKDRIEKLYIIDERPLNWIMDHMRKEYGINLSVKQYKSQLKTWGLRHKLTKRDAAFILRLLDQAKREGRDEVVIFSGHPRRREDIAKYIVRNDKVEDEDALLSCITDEDKTPDYIAFPDEPQPPPPSHLPPTPPSASSFGSLESHASFRPISPMKVPIPSPESSPRHSGEFSHDLNHAAALSGPIYGHEAVPFDLGIVREHASMHQAGWARSQPAIPNILGPFWRAQREPIPSGWCQLWDNNDPSKQWPADFTNAVLSATPAVVEETSDFEIDIYRFGNNTHSRQLNDNSLSADFVMYCLYWLICAGQKDARFQSKTEYYLTNALFSFLCMLTNDTFPAGECLGALSIVSVLFDCYGQWDRLSELLTKCDELTKNHCGLDNPLTMTIEFKKNMLQRSGAGCPPHDIARLSHIVTQMKICFSESSAPALTARYNLAWAMLENELKKEVWPPENFEAARRELLDLTRQWEQYGDDRIETIMAAATLARATFYCGDAEGAEAIIVQSVLPRVRKNFPDQHAYSWEAKHRHAFFLFQLAKKETGARKRSHLQLGEQLLREVVRNRHRILGESNPKSTHSFRLLRDILKAQDKMLEADTLSEWCEQQQSPFGVH
ncbi:Clr5 domain-containing protein [Cladophialophora immunda]|nr:Clr5 domain-containing protein [Cladophialophora immunda]